MILITGATGKLGGKVIETLLENNVPASQIAALVRDEGKAAILKEKGIDIRIGDYDDRYSLSKAMKGVDRVLLVSGLDMSKIMEQHRNVVDTAKSAGVNCFSYTSNCLRDRETLVNYIMQTHYETEDYIIASGMNYQIFRNVLYMDSMAGYLLGKDFLDNGIHLPAGDGRVSYALRSDEAEAIGNVLSTGDCISRIYNFTNTQTYSFDDVADALSEISGKSVKYFPLTMDVYKTEAKTKGVPDHALEMMLPFYTDIANGQGSTVSNDLEEALGRKPVDLKSGLKLLLNL